MREQWLLKQRKRDEIENLKEELNIDLLTSILLVNRNIKDEKDAMLTLIIIFQIGKMKGMV